jgi:hypothetical protein
MADTDIEKVEQMLGPIGNGAFLDLKPLYDTKKPENGLYRLDQKCEAVVMMQAVQDVNPNSLDMEPDYNSVSDLLGYDHRTLKRWWGQRDNILKASTDYVEGLRDVHLLKLFTITQKVEEQMLNYDLSNVPFKDLAMAVKTLTIVRSVVQDGSEHNTKTVNHNHRVMVVKPALPE